MNTELAWAAGFFDGEGTTCRVKGPTRNATRVSVSQKGLECLLRFQAALGGLGHIYERKCTISLFSIGRIEDVDIALTRLWPYLSGPKREQAQRAGFSLGAIRRAITGRPKGVKDRLPRKRRVS